MLLKSFVFDLDGTLVDTVQPHTVTWQRSMSEIGLIVPANRIRFWIGAGSRRLALAMSRRARRVITPTELDQIRARHQQLMAQLSNPPIVLPGAAELLRELTRRGIRWGIATSGRHPAVGHALTALQAPTDTPLVTFNDVSLNKPHPQALLMCAERMEVPATDCWMVGDAVWDIYAARRAGMGPIAVKTGGATAAQLRTAGAKLILRDPQHLLNRLDDLISQASA